jgi:hypothetical protein
MVMTEETWIGFRCLIKALEGFRIGRSATEVRHTYLDERRQLLGISSDEQHWLPMTVVGCLTRGVTREAGDLIRSTFEQLPTNVKAILAHFMARTGVEDLGFVLYYAPAILANRKASKDPNWLSDGLNTLARLYHGAHSAIVLSGRSADVGVCKVMCDKVAALAKESTLADFDFGFEPVGYDFQVTVTRSPSIDLSAFNGFNLGDLAGRTVGLIGIGGGSDIVQAAMLGDLLRKKGAKVAFVAEVRGAKTGSQGADGAIGILRELTNPLANPIPNVYQVGPGTRCTGRFAAHLIAADFPTYTVIDQGDLANTLRDFCALFQDLDTLLLVDTGGDATYRTGDDQGDTAKTTPDQDLRVLRAAKDLQRDLHVMTMEIGVGTDAPPYVQETLTRGRAKFIPLGNYAEEIHRYYRRIEDGLRQTTGSAFIGKTPLAFEAALRGSTGRVALGIPTNLVLSSTNPWTPFVLVPHSGAMAGAFVMDLPAHLQAIGAAS